MASLTTEATQTAEEVAKTTVAGDSETETNAIAQPQSAATSGEEKDTNSTTSPSNPSIMNCIGQTIVRFDSGIGGTQECNQMQNAYDALEFGNGFVLCCHYKVEDYSSLRMNWSPPDSFGLDDMSLPAYAGQKNWGGLDSMCFNKTIADIMDDDSFVSECDDNDVFTISVPWPNLYSVSTLPGYSRKQVDRFLMSNLPGQGWENGGMCEHIVGQTIVAIRPRTDEDKLPPSAYEDKFANKEVIELSNGVLLFVQAHFEFGVENNATVESLETDNSHKNPDHEEFNQWGFYAEYFQLRDDVDAYSKLSPEDKIRFAQPLWIRDEMTVEDKMLPFKLCGSEYYKSRSTTGVPQEYYYNSPVPRGIDLSLWQDKEYIQEDGVTVEVSSDARLSRRLKRG